MRQALLLVVFLLICIASAVTAEPPRIRYDIPYVEPANKSSRLDVYAPSTGSDHPIIVWIHGGGWRNGDKAQVQAKPEALNGQGFILVSINYRLNSDATYEQQAGDVAKAVRWVHDHAREFGGSPDHLFVMGHSAGAHLAALVATDHRYLVAEGLKLSNLQGVILLDGACYDIPKQISQAPFPRLKEMYRTVFGTDLSKQQDASPITHVTPGKGIPPFLILHVADRRDSRLQSEALAERLKLAGTSAKVVAAEGKNHATINRELGNAGDLPTEALFEFLKKQMGEHGK